ncbi:FAD-binding oxidoreductase [Actinomadura rugatobispora]|uniref:FAD-binding oxidoreductase n=1 Tax=Actinomadura rugatobispora TaxID=1994 RepID=A0ABW0ZW17_9ACTN|nr:FAD-binding oxidoreductase [Actinomadura rugatobispora]
MSAAFATPATTLRPTSLRELRDAVADSAGSHPRLLVAGTGSAADWGGVPEPADALLDMTAMTGVLAHNPADMTMALRAGTPLSDLRARLAPHGQRVAFDPARDGATVGGLLATGDGGPARQTYGILRDLVIGITVVLADGTVASSGGHVIKNVAGYDMAKLFHGSLGTLGVVAEVVVRLHPVPESDVTVAVPVDLAEAAVTASRIVAGGVEPAALEWCQGRLLVRLEGAAGGPRERAAAVRALAGAGEVVDDDAWREVARIALGDPGDTVLRFGALPTVAVELAGEAKRIGVAHGVDVAVAGSVGVGVHTVRLRGGEAGAHAAVLDAIRTAVHSRDGAASVRRRDGLTADVPAWGPPPPAVGVMRAVKQRFDPDGRFGAGRFAPWFPALEGASP